MSKEISNSVFGNLPNYYEHLPDGLTAETADRVHAYDATYMEMSLAAATSNYRTAVEAGQPEDQRYSETAGNITFAHRIYHGENGHQIVSSSEIAMPNYHKCITSALDEIKNLRKETLEA